jgi:hypothetical protein
MIARASAITNPRSVVVPAPDFPGVRFDSDLFHIYSSVVKSCTDPGLSFSGRIPMLLEVVKSTVKGDRPASCMRDSIIRKCLLTFQYELLWQSGRPILSQIAVLHNELLLISDLLTSVNSSWRNFCDMLLGEAYDIYNAEVDKMIEKTLKKSNEDGVLNGFCKDEIENLRLLCEKNFQILSSCIMRRFLEKASSQGAVKIENWAKQNGIVIQE